VKIVVLSTPLGPALAAAATDLAAAPTSTAEEWQLPDGLHALAGGLTLDVTGRSLRIQGSAECTLQFASGGLVLRADSVEIRGLTLDTADGAAALRIEAPRITLSDVDAAATSATAVTAIDLLADPTGSIDLEDLRVTRAKGTDSVGLRAIGGTVRVTGAEVSHIDGTGATGVYIGAVGDATAVEIEVDDVKATAAALGIMIAAGRRIEGTRLQASAIAGASALGVGVFGFGVTSTSDAGVGDTVSVVDLDVETLTAAARATGIFVAAPRRLTVRGFTATQVIGSAATGALIAGGAVGGTQSSADDPESADVEVGFGHVEGVVASAGDAAGVRVIAQPSPQSVIVRDVAVTGVAGAPVPASDLPARDGDGESAWQTWAGEILADLADDVVPRTVPPVVLDAPDVVGLSVTAVVDDVQPFLDEIGAGDVAVVDSSVQVVSGSALQLETGLRPAWLRRTEFSTALRAGFVQADQLIIANTTWDRLGAPLAIGPGEVRAFDSIFSRVSSAAGPVTLDPDADWTTPQAVFADVVSQWFQPLGALPYVAAGADGLPAPLLGGALPPAEEIDLRLVAGSPLHAAAVAPPADDLNLSDDSRLFVGAQPPDVPARCGLYDPLRPPTGAAPQPAPSSPVVDYRARDAKALLGVMLDRAQVVMQPWTDRGPADFTTMMLETVAERLDQIAYQQERAVAEGFLDDARLRRSVEDHVRPLDYQVDPGLSATTMLRFHLDLARIADVIASRQQEAARTTDDERKAFLTSTLAALTALADDGALEIPAGTVVANQRDDDQVIMFTSEEPLPYFPEFDTLSLVDDVPAGATSASLHGALPGLAIGRWLVLCPGPGKGGTVVRVTSLARGSDVVQVGWDPRRPLPWPLVAKDGAVVFGNVTPAHHGVQLSALPEQVGNPDLQRFCEPLDLNSAGGPGVEIPLPFGPVSIQAPGFPLPGDEGRRGRPAVRVLVGDDEWARAEDLCGAGQDEEVFVLRTAADGRATLRFGDGVSGAALPERSNRLRFDITVGAGRIGNVGEGILQRLLFVPCDASRGPITGWLFREDMEVIRGLLTVDNPIAAVGGRDPEPIDRMRYRAPLLAARPLSAVTPDDYERVARALPGVAGAHAQVVPSSTRPVMRVTVLLQHEDTLDPDERLRRWAAVRSALEGARLLGFDVESVPPLWVPLDLDVVVDAHPHAEAGAVRDAVIATISGDGGLLDPDTGGLGGDVQLADLYRAVMSASGVTAARVRRFRRLLPHAPERLRAGFIPINSDEVAVVRGPARPAADGVLTVSVCGGLR